MRSRGRGWPASLCALGDLYALMPRVYQLAASLPDAPLAQFQAKVKDLPTSTEAERLVVHGSARMSFGPDCSSIGRAAVR